MSQDFKLKFDEMREGNPTGGKEDEHLQSYPASSNIRNIVFVWPDGRNLFLNYAYLVSGEFKPENNSIVLEFTTHTVTIKGQKLQTLFDDLFVHLTQRIVCQDQRYNVIDGGENPVVNEIHAVRL